MIVQSSRVCGVSVGLLSQPLANPDTGSMADEIAASRERQDWEENKVRVK